MLRAVEHSECAGCKFSEYKYNMNRERLLVCKLNEPLYPRCFKPEDWRDMIILDEGDKKLKGDDRRKQAEKENPHIVEIVKQNRRERAFKKAYARIMAQIKQDKGRI